MHHVYLECKERLTSHQVVERRFLGRRQKTDGLDSLELATAHEQVLAQKASRIRDESDKRYS